MLAHMSTVTLPQTGMVAQTPMATHIPTRLPTGVQCHQLATVKLTVYHWTPHNGVIEMVMVLAITKMVTYRMNVLTNLAHQQSTELVV